MLTLCYESFIRYTFCHRVHIFINTHYRMVFSQCFAVSLVSIQDFNQIRRTLSLYLAKIYLLLANTKQPSAHHPLFPADPPNFRHRHTQFWSTHLVLELDYEFTGAYWRCQYNMAQIYLRRLKGDASTRQSTEFALPPP